MRKLYLILDNRGNFVSRGNSGKSAWRSLYWVNYHIGRNPNEYKIMTLFRDGKTEIAEAIEVLSNLPSYKQKLNADLSIAAGFECTAESLLSIYKAGVLGYEAQSHVGDILRRKKIVE